MEEIRAMGRKLRPIAVPDLSDVARSNSGQPIAGWRRGYKWGEGSTIGETNIPSRRDAERAGGERYKTYRIYQKAL
jgi:hypothetical protein